MSDLNDRAWNKQLSKLNCIPSEKASTLKSQNSLPFFRPFFPNGHGAQKSEQEVTKAVVHVKTAGKLPSVSNNLKYVGYSDPYFSLHKSDQLYSISSIGIRTAYWQMIVNVMRTLILSSDARSVPLKCIRLSLSRNTAYLEVKMRSFVNH